MMAVHFDWLIPLRVIQSHIFGSFSQDQLNIYVQDLSTYLQEGMGTLHLLVNTSNLTLTTNETAFYPELHLEQDDVLKKLGSVYVIDDRIMLPGLPFLSLFPAEHVAIKQVHRLSDAIGQLKQLDNSLQWDKAC